MGASRLFKALATVALFNGMLLVCVRDEIMAADKEAEAKQYLEDLKKGKDAKSKITALQGLGRLAAVQKILAEPALPTIYKSLDDKDAGVRAAAAMCLGQCDEPADKAVPALTKMVKNDKEQESVRVSAMLGLASMGPAAKDALPTLREIQKNNDKKSQLFKTAQKANKAIAGKP